MEGKLVVTEKKDSMIIISLNRPEKRNAISTEMMVEFDAVLDQVATDRQVRTIIIRGEGKCFSSGIDLMSFTQQDPAHVDTTEFRYLLAKSQSIHNRMEAIEKPVIALLHSYCFGLGSELALAADFRIAAEDTQFALQEVELGLIPDVGGITRLVRTVGIAMAKEIIMMARRIDARRACEIHLVNEVVASDELMPTAIKWAEQLSNCAPLAVGLAKKTIDRGAHLDKLSFMELEACAQSILLQTNDVKEGILSRMQKRAPNFKGE